MPKEEILRFAQNDKRRDHDKDPMTAIILAGGKNVRMGGRNKAFLKFGEKTFIEHQVEALRSVFDEVIISTNSPEEYSHLNLPIVTDLIPYRGPLGGIYSGLTRASSFFSFVIACDMPFVNIELIKLLKELTLLNPPIPPLLKGGAGGILQSALDYDVVVPRSKKGLEPLHAFYSKNCIEPMRRQIDSGGLKLTDFLSSVKVRVVTTEEMCNIKGVENALRNLNTDADYSTALKAQAPS